MYSAKKKKLRTGLWWILLLEIFRGGFLKSNQHKIMWFCCWLSFSQPIWQYCNRLNFTPVTATFIIHWMNKAEKRATLVFLLVFLLWKFYIFWFKEDAEKLYFNMHTKNNIKCTYVNDDKEWEQFCVVQNFKFVRVYLTKCMAARGKQKKAEKNRWF